MTDRRRNALILLVVAGLIAVSALMIGTKKTLLGLELKGGVQLTYQAKPTAQSKVTPETLERAIDIMRKRVDQLGVAQPEIQSSGGDQIVVSLPDVTNYTRAQEEVGKTAQLYFYDWEPNVIGATGEPAPKEGTVTGDTTSQGPGGATSGLLEYQAILRAAKRKPILPPKNSDLASYSPGCTAAQKEGCIYGSWYLVEPAHEKVLRGPEETEHNLYTDLHRSTKGTKAIHVNPGTVIVEAHAEESRESKVTNPTPNSWYVLNDDPVLEGKDITSPTQSFNEGGGGNGAPDVTFGFTSHGKKVFEHITKVIAERGQEARLPGVSKEAALQHFAVVLDDQLITVPSIDFTQYPEGIDASNGSEISGGFTITTAQNLANELQSGALPVKLVLISKSTVSATLGKQALNQSVEAGLIGLLVVCAFLLLFYRLLGLIAIGGLTVYGVYFYGLIKLIPVTLTLPGIAGLILTIGVCADANIVIFERVKEEIRGGRSVISGIATGYKHGFAAIVDANVVTIMTAFILFALATAEVKGFAFMLGIGTFVSLFTAVLATQAVLGAMSHSRLVSHPSMLRAKRRGGGWRYDFMGASRWFFSLSGTILLIGALAIGGNGLHFGIDFKGGTRIETAITKSGVSTAEVASVLAEAHYANAQVQKFNNASVGGHGFEISTKTLSPENVKKVESKLSTKFEHGGQPGIKDFSSTSIGPTFGKTVANSAVIAIIASLLVISAYIALRFEWKYAVPVLIALMHDLLITSGVYALTGREVTTATVAALLTILGYSLYDTIIVFDRVRENVPRMPRAAFSQILNRSMSEVLTRSLATSFCTLLPVISLFIFGGRTLKDFAFALIVGIASGAYSSIFIASPVLMHWKEREPGFRARRQRIEREVGVVPAFATTATGELEDVEPDQARRRRTRRGSLIAPEQPGQQISRDEFQELVADLDVGSEENGGSTRAPARPPRGRVAGVAEAPPATPPAQAAPERDPAADLTPEDLVLKETAKPRAKNRRARNKRHGRR
ncbi:MAG TPA: protein translocase subunit SecD [Solirubrobacteraceae bacterium]|jgi:SecD/SecF fusion protein|nr:protein translocase subunit SecD [Solirubrobacteraceae bacterium]